MAKWIAAIVPPVAESVMPGRTEGVIDFKESTIIVDSDLVGLVRGEKISADILSWTGGDGMGYEFLLGMSLCVCRGGGGRGGSMGYESFFWE